MNADELIRQYLHEVCASIDECLFFESLSQWGMFRVDRYIQIKVTV